ncbi:MAG: LptE family protein [Candidatus Omnitrophota bacterium]
MNNNLRRIFWIFTFLLLLSGCGYQNLTRHPVAFSVYFPILANRTMEPGVEVVLTNAITRELLGSGITVAKEKDADYSLSGTVDFYTRVPLSFRSDDPKEVNQYRLEVVVRMEITPAPAPPSPLIFSPAGRGERSVSLTSSSNYFLTGPFSRSEAAALKALASDLARKSTEWITQQ